MPPAALSTSAMTTLLHSSTPIVPDSLNRLTNASGDMLACAERIFWAIVGMKEDDKKEDGNVFLNVPHLFEILTFLATVGSAESSRIIKDKLFKLGGKGENTFYSNENHERLLCETVAHDLKGWDERIRTACTDQEYSSRRRLYMNRKACRSYSYSTVQAMNGMSIEWKISAGLGELGRWAYGDQLEGRKCPFTIWKYDDENVEQAEERKVHERLKRKSKKTPHVHKAQNTAYKCPLLITASSFRIPVHPLLVDGAASYTMNVDCGAKVKAIKFVNDSTRMMSYRTMKQATEGAWQNCAVLPCRNAKDNTTMKLLIFWGALSEVHNIIDQMTTVVGGDPDKKEWNLKEINELHLPVWNPLTDAVNLADPICQSLSDHVFSEGSFGDLTEAGVTPCVREHNGMPPAIQTFDCVSVRVASDDQPEEKGLFRGRPGVYQVTLPYMIVVYDDSVKMPIYLGRIAQPLMCWEEEKKHEHKKPSCTIM